MPSFTLKLAGYDKALAELGEGFEAKLNDAARFAINDTARWAIGHIRKDMYSNVAFPSGYLDREDRLSISRFASSNELSAQIYSRDEPTSLARFATDATNRGGVMVNVKRGNMAKRVRNSFIMGLKKGQVAKGNSGLIIRSKDKPSGAYKPRPLGDKWPDLWAAYGPSVYQVFKNSMDRFEPEIMDRLEMRFEHHRKRLIGA